MQYRSKGALISHLKKKHFGQSASAPPPVLLAKKRTTLQQQDDSDKKQEFKKHEEPDEELDVPNKKVRKAEKVYPSMHKCPYCDKWYGHKMSVYRHVSSIHQNVMDVNVNVDVKEDEDEKLQASTLGVDEEAQEDGSFGSSKPQQEEQAAAVAVDVANLSTQNVPKLEFANKRTKSIVVQLSHLQKFLQHMLTYSSATQVEHSTVLTDVQREFDKLEPLICELEIEGHEEVAAQWTERKFAIWSQIVAYKTRFPCK